MFFFVFVHSQFFIQFLNQRFEKYLNNHNHLGQSDKVLRFWILNALISV